MKHSSFVQNWQNRTQWFVGGVSALRDRSPYYVTRGVTEYNVTIVSEIKCAHARYQLFSKQNETPPRWFVGAALLRLLTIRREASCLRLAISNSVSAATKSRCSLPRPMWNELTGTVGLLTDQRSLLKAPGRLCSVSEAAPMHCT